MISISMFPAPAPPRIFWPLPRRPRPVYFWPCSSPPCPAPWKRSFPAHSWNPAILIGRTSTHLQLQMYIYKSTSTPTKTLSIPTSTPSTSTKKYTKVVLSKGVNLLVFGVPGLIDVVAYQNDKFEVCLPPHKTCNMILWSRFQKSSLYFSGGSDIVILFYIKKPFTRLVKEGTFITSHRGQLLNSKSEWHQAKVVRTRTEVVQGGLSEILHRKNFRTKLLHRHFHRISTVSDRNSKNEWKWRNLHCLQKIYTAAGSDGMDKSHLCKEVPR